jgi:hypothetical protein
MWAQGVENLVRDCVLKYLVNGRISPINDTLEKIKNTMGLGGLTYEFKPCISEELFIKFKGFSKDRNKLAHDAADRYMVNSIAGATGEEIEREIWKFEENKRVAGELYGELLELHTEFSA